MKLKQMSKETNLTEGEIFFQVIGFTLPVVFTNLLQLLFNTADVIVVGRFSGTQALAAVGATSTLTGLMVNLFIGVSVGANVMASIFYGANNKEELHDTVHTAILTALVGGFIIFLLGEITSEYALTILGTPGEIMKLAMLYLRIYYIGMPFLFVFNFEVALLRAVGDTRTPLYILIFSGILNVICNLILVLGFNLSIAGVAIATVFSHIVSMLIATIILVESSGDYRINWHELRFYPGKMTAMLKIGIPAAIQTTTMTLSTLLIQSSVNSFGTVVMGGHTASGNIDAFLYTPLYAFSQTALSFAGQNLGAGKWRRVRKANRITFSTVMVLGTIMGCFVYAFAPQIIGIFTSDPEAIYYGALRTRSLAFFYGFCGLMETIPQTVRGMGSSVVPSIIAIATICLLRIFWVYVVFPVYHDYQILNYSFPVAWILAVLVQGSYYMWIVHRYPSTHKELNLTL